MGRKGWIALAIAGGLLMLGPLAGIFVTTIGMVLAFRATESVDPAMKAEHLARGISLAMNATVIGIVLLPVGAILFGVSLWQLRRAPDRGEGSPGRGEG